MTAFGPSATWQRIRTKAEATLVRSTADLIDFPQAAGFEAAAVYSKAQHRHTP
jgi:hypothetical protein